jgi:hypothetical protein
MNKSIGQPKIKEILIFDFQKKGNVFFIYPRGEKGNEEESGSAGDSP